MGVPHLNLGDSIHFSMNELGPNQNCSAFISSREANHIGEFLHQNVQRIQIKEEDEVENPMALSDIPLTSPHPVQK